MLRNTGDGNELAVPATNAYRKEHSVGWWYTVHGWVRKRWDTSYCCLLYDARTQSHVDTFIVDTEPSKHMDDIVSVTHARRWYCSATRQPVSNGGVLSQLHNHAHDRYSTSVT